MNTKDLKVFFIYSIFKGIFSFANIICFFILDSRPAYLTVLRFDLMVEYVLIGYLFRLHIENSLIRNLLKISVVPFVIYCLIDLFTQDPGKFRNLPMLIEQIIFMSVIIFVFFEKMKLNSLIPVYQTINFWILVGLFVYFSGLFFFILLAEEYKDDEKLQWELFMINTFVIIVKNIILGMALTVKEPKENPEDYEFMIPLEMDLDSFTPSNHLN